MRFVVANLFLVIALFWQATPISAQDLDAQQVRDAIERGVDFLRTSQDSTDGTWGSRSTYGNGITALCTLALLNCGMPLDDPAMQRALEQVRRPLQSRRTYVVSLQTMVLCVASPEKDRLLIRENVRWLENAQVRNGPSKGAWTYGVSNIGGDPSNTQFAMLALYEAERIGISVRPDTWQRALAYWTGEQLNNGGWKYPDHPPSGSMTCAGISSMIIALGQVSKGDARVVGGEVECCVPHAENESVENAFEWLGQNFSVKSNPTGSGGRTTNFNRGWLMYYLYGLERVGRLSGRRYIGGRDWYREGVAELLRRQDVVTGSWRGIGLEENRDISSSMALLFLAKGRRPVLVSKYRSGTSEDWNRHRQDLAHLTAHVERRWDQDLTWQTVQGDVASVEDLLQSPVLYISGRDGLSLDPGQRRRLKQYVQAGGFLFFESCCEGDGFDRDVRQFLAEEFPESPLRPLPVDHPVWYAEQPVPTEFLRPLLGVDACCRTSIIYCPGELSCYWELGSVRNRSSLPADVRQEVEAALAIGANVMTYATNRQLREKLDTPPIAETRETDPVERRFALQVAKVQHGGGSDDAPNALTNALSLTEQLLQLPISTDKRMVALNSPKLSEFPIVYMHGRRNFSLSAAERSGLANYLGNGGFLFADAICASEPFADALRRELLAAVPEGNWIQLPPDHVLFTNSLQGFDIREVQLRDPRPVSGENPNLQAFVERVAPTLEAFTMDGRVAVIFSPYDLSCAMENQASLQCKGYLQEDAARIFVNVLLYAMSGRSL